MVNTNSRSVRLHLRKMVEKSDDGRYVFISIKGS